MEQPNLNYIYNMSGGNKDFEKKIIHIIKTEFPQEKAIYFKNLEANNYKQTAENVHKLKHKISILGLENSYAMAVNYENNLMAHSTEGKIEFEAILQNITDFLKTL
ncbi:histidine kinase [Winogradskyella sp. J14-2]|uniref:histidine kinase n=1 Tax=Winogradskyella sp. J14-2 TaxID=1936080 RepID=UPI0009727399|nr:histidine kinase [Winogradskyella sp. J14-2]APY08077.1 histidine kinase [Winogradskyella sp. J14-2]